jgi:hypothetical protein
MAGSDLRDRIDWFGAGGHSEKRNFDNFVANVTELVLVGYFAVITYPYSLVVRTV